MSKKTNQAQENNEVSIDNSIVSIRQSTNMSKSAKIRALHDLGIEKAEISKILYIRYQFVRNVLNQPLKKND